MTLSPKTALITGASSGLGAVFARHLAAAGYGLILVARRQERLEALAGELVQRYGISSEVFPADLADPEAIARLEERLAACETLELLVNNAGFGLPGRFAQVEVEGQLAMLRVHVECSLRLTRAALPGFLARHRGAIINVASIAAYLPAAGDVTYSAGKAYLINFSEALSVELAGSGVHVQALCPGFTHTEFHDGPAYENFRRAALPPWMWMQADQVVAASLAALPGGRAIVIPGLVNRLIVAVASNGLTRPLVRLVARRLLRR